jgi:thiol-disulfide isomerase/thioredoxin
MKIVCNKFLSVLFIFICICLDSIQGQELHIGDQIPDVKLNHIINYPQSSARLSDFKAPLTIIDFWSITCHGCIESFPHMDALQKQYGKNIRILFVNKETEKVTRDFFEHHKNVHLPDLPFITEDTLFSKWIPYSTVPHHLWTDSLRHIIASTGGWNATTEHINSFLKKGTIRLKVKKDAQWIESNLPMMVFMDTAVVRRASYYSYLMPASGYAAEFKRQSTDGTRVINHLMLNYSSLLDILKVAYGEDGKYDFHPGNTILLNVRDKNEFTPPHDQNFFDEWEDHHSFLYEIMVPEKKAGNLYLYMQQDLTHFMNADVKHSKREIDCWVLVRTDSTVQLSLPGTDTFSIQSVKSDKGIFNIYKNISWGKFVHNMQRDLSSEGFPAPLKDGTGLPDNFIISYSDAGLFGTSQRKIDMERFKLILKSFGVDVILKKWTTDVLVISE